MPYTLTFHTFLEKRPAHGEEIVLLRQFTSFGGFYGFHPDNVTVEYCWFEYDEDGQTGTQCCYDPDDPTPPESEDGEDWKLHVLVGGYIADDPRFEKHYLWMSTEDWFKSLPEN